MATMLNISRDLMNADREHKSQIKCELEPPSRCLQIISESDKCNAKKKYT